MSRHPVLYLAVAAPLVEDAREWLVGVPGATPEERKERLKSFPPLDHIGAYSVQPFDAYQRLRFWTGQHVSRERVLDAISGWAQDNELPVSSGRYIHPISPIDYREGIAALQQALHGFPVSIEARIGVTLQVLQKDLAHLRPEMVLLYCHGTEEGCLLFEDGRGRAEFVSGARIFKLFTSRPRVLLMNACYSGTVLKRAKDSADWKDSAVISVDPSTPLEVGAGTAFQVMFFQELLRGRTAQEAFLAAQLYVANDSHFGDLSVPAGETPPSKKFHLRGHDLSIAVSAAGVIQTPPEPHGRAVHVRRVRRSSERFIGRRREMAQCLDALLPLPVGLHRGPSQGERRLVTLTKEGGIGKTAMATEIADWVAERGLFAGGVYELACESYMRAEELLSKLLEVFGIPAGDQRGDLFELLQAMLLEKFPREKSVLLVLDNLDDLFARTPERARAAKIGRRPSQALHPCGCWPPAVGRSVWLTMSSVSRFRPCTKTKHATCSLQTL